MIYTLSIMSGSGVGALTTILFTTGGGVGSLILSTFFLGGDTEHALFSQDILFLFYFMK